MFVLVHVTTIPLIWLSSLFVDGLPQLIASEPKSTLKIKVLMFLKKIEPKIIVASS